MQNKVPVTYSGKVMTLNQLSKSLALHLNKEQFFKNEFKNGSFGRIVRTLRKMPCGICCRYLHSKMKSLGNHIPFETYEVKYPSNTSTKKISFC